MRAGRTFKIFRSVGEVGARLPFTAGTCLVFLALASLPARAQSFSCNPPAANPIVCENSKPGTAPRVWQITWQMGDAGDPTIQGFATDISVNHGQTVTFKIDTDAPAYRIEIYRLGYYNGKGARLITTINPSATLPQTQPDCVSDPTTRLYDCGNWQVSASWNVPADAPSGIYFAKPTRSDTGGFSHIVFVVRDDEGKSDLLFKTSDETWQAYNNYGGYSLYGSSHSNWDITQRAYKVSYNRPFNTNHISPQTWLFSSEYPMVRWLESNGYNVSYFTAVDGARNPALILSHKAFLSVGHDEYWSGDLRSSVEAARDAGVNLAFFSGNEVFWKTRWENSIDGSGTPYRTLVTYKETWAAARIDPADPSTWTGTWRDPTFSPTADGGHPENALTGTSFAVNSDSNFSINVPADDGKMRFWRNTSLANIPAGQSVVLPFATLGYEWDIDADNGFRPAGLVHLSTTTQEVSNVLLLNYGTTYGSGSATHHLSFYRAASGALVFGAGTVQWTWGLEAHNNAYSFPSAPPSTDMRQATVNLFADMGAQPANLQPGLVPATQSTDTQPPTSHITSPQPGASLSREVPTFITGTAADTGGGVVGGVEVSTDGGATWHPAIGRDNWAFAYTPPQEGSITIMSRAVDDSGNLEIPSGSLTVNVQGSFAIAGSIAPAGAGSGATLTLSGTATQIITADAYGDYLFAGLTDGTYTITPGGGGYSFGPSSQIVTLHGSSAGGVNFTASQSTTTSFSISGSVTPAALGAGVTLTLTGPVTGSTVTDAAGNFSFAGVPDGMYVINPSKPGLIFSPIASTVVVAEANVTGLAFSASSVGQTLFTTQVPQKLHLDDGPNINYELGTQFQSDIDGSISAIRFWKDSWETGTHTGNIWDNTGNLLASVVFANETDSGWQQQTLDEPVFITASTPYVVSVNTGNTKYVATNEELSSPVVNGHLQSVAGSNGVYGSPGSFPTNSYASTNYYRDIVFVPPANASLWYVWVPGGQMLGGGTVTGWIGITNSAPAGGAAVTLTSDDPSATVPETIVIPAGLQEAPFTVQTAGVRDITAVHIYGIYNQRFSTTLTLIPPSLTQLTIAPATITGGSLATGTVTLSGPAPPGGMAVALLSGSPAATSAPSVIVEGGQTSANFTVSTSSVNVPTPITFFASFNTLQSVPLMVLPTTVASFALAPEDVIGGDSSTGTVTLSGAAPAGGAVVALSSDLPTVSGIAGVYAVSDLPSPGSVDWGGFGPDYTAIPSGASTAVNGIAGVNLTISNAAGQGMEALSNCTFGGACPWYGNFADGARVLWVNGTYYSDTGWWAGNGPLTIQFDSPQRGIGFQAMGDETGPFTATICAYNSSSTLLGCLPFTGNGTGVADNSAAFMGLYDDAQEISRVTIDAGGQLYPHDFGIAQLFVTNTRRPFLPSSVTVPAGASSASFAINAPTIATPTTVHLTATYNLTLAATLTINPADISSVTLAPSSIAGGHALTGMVTLTGTAPAGGALVALSANNPVSSGVQLVNSSTGIPHDNTVTWTDLGPSFTAIASGTAVPIPGAPGSTVTVANATGAPLYIFTSCPALADCGWSGNFVPAAPLLWVDGSYDDTGTTWTGDGPLTLTFNTPQRGVGFNVMADEAGAFSGTICAYNSASTLLGCEPFTGDGEPLAGGTFGMAIFAGLYDDTAEITTVTIDAGGALYPHDFAIDQLVLATSRRMVPATVTVQPGARTATFAVNTDTVSSPTTVTVTGHHQSDQSTTLTVNP